MKHILKVFCITLLLHACNSKVDSVPINSIDWNSRTAKINPTDSLIFGSTYLSVYSEIYSQSAKRTQDLTATISMRNTSTADTIYMSKVVYYNTEGNIIRSYFENSIYLSPMETLEIIVDEQYTEGGTGGNFVFDWMINENTSEPIFECVLISTSGQQGLSFSTMGKRIN